MPRSGGDHRTSRGGGGGLPGRVGAGGAVGDPVGAPRSEAAIRPGGGTAAEGRRRPRRDLAAVVFAGGTVPPRSLRIRQPLPAGGGGRVAGLGAFGDGPADGAGHL